MCDGQHAPRPRRHAGHRIAAGLGSYTCTACHGTAVIGRSRLTREGWDELMDWMAEKQGMAPLEGEERRVIVDYLARAFPPGTRQQRRGGNPFLTQQ